MSSNDGECVKLTVQIQSLACQSTAVPGRQCGDAKELAYSGQVTASREERVLAQEFD